MILKKKATTLKELKIVKDANGKNDFWKVSHLLKNLRGGGREGERGRGKKRRGGEGRGEKEGRGQGRGKRKGRLTSVLNNLLMKVLKSNIKAPQAPGGLFSPGELVLSPGKIGSI
jgi:hypothetical protein